MTEKQLLKKRKELAAELLEIDIQIMKARRQTVIKCHHCGKGTKVSKLTLIQTHWYESPYGCTGGDQWFQGEKQYDCPKCGKRCREHFNREIKKLAAHFKDTTKVYDR